MVEQLSPDREHLPDLDVCPEILGRINAREQDIERLLLEARQSAARRLLEARRLADEVVAGQHADAADEVSLLLEQRRAEARRQAAEILGAAARAAAAARAVAPERLESVAARLLDMMLPGGGIGRTGS